MITFESLSPIMDVRVGEGTTFVGGLADTIADQVAGTYPLTPRATTARSAMVRGGIPLLVADSTTNGGTAYLNAAIPINTQSFTICYLAELPRVSSGQLFGGPGASAFGLGIDNQQALSFYGNGVTRSFTGALNNGGLGLYVVTGSASALNLYLPTGELTAGAATAGTITGLAFCGATNYAPTFGRWNRAVVYDTTLSVANVRGLYDYCRTTYNARTSWRKQLNIIGTSIENVGGGVAGGRPYWDLGLSNLPEDVLVVNYAQDGRTCLSMLGDPALATARTLASIGAANSIDYIGSPINDIIGGANGTVAAQRQLAVAALSKAAGRKTVLGGLLPESTLGANYALYWAEIDARIGEVEALVDPRKSPIYSTASIYTNARYYNVDQRHPGALGHEVLSPVFGDTMRPLLTPPSVSIFG